MRPPTSIRAKAAVKRQAVVAGFILLLAVVSGQAASPALAATTNTAITVDGTSPGRTFDGIGAISGGGGNSRLLYDYPAAQQTQILNYLFKPDYGADLQILKVEIGGDTNSTDGAEPSIEHAQGTVNCNAGYEFWLMEQAKALNPNIKFYALAWGAPGWVGSTFWTTNTINYLVSWLGCAKQDGLTIGYLGGWNERGYNDTWYEQLRSTLDADGYSSVQIVGDDSFGWDMPPEMLTTPALDNAVDIVGSHYPCGYLTSMSTCSSTADAVATGKPLWASETGSQDANSGAAPLARALNRSYIDADITGNINWPLVAGAYSDTDFSTDGLLIDDQPWSGNYTVGESTWAIAQTTQFTSPGWQYLNTADGYLGGNRANGSYVTYMAPGKTAWSTVIETMDATAAQTVSMSVAGGLPSGTLHVWATNITGGGTMQHAQDLTATNGTYSLTLQPGYIYTVTTTTGQGAGTTTSPARSALALPYSDTFGEYSNGQEAKYFSAMNGAFEAEPCQGGVSGQCLTQQAPTTPVRWTGETSDQPYTMMGDTSWSNYTVSSKVLLEQAGSTVDLLGRVGTQAKNNNGLDAYHLELSDNGTWSLLKSDTTWTWTTLASGTISAPGTNTWQTLALTFQGSTITAVINGKTVGTVTDTSYGTGMIGLGTAGYYPAQYSDLTITPGTGPASLNGTHTLGVVGNTLDDPGFSTTTGVQQDTWSVNGGQNQSWVFTQQSDGSYQIANAYSGLCLDVSGVSNSPGAQVIQWTCKATDTTNQRWIVTSLSNGSYTLAAQNSGLLLSTASTAVGALVTQQANTNSTLQQWSIN